MLTQNSLCKFDQNRFSDSDTRASYGHTEVFESPLFYFRAPQNKYFTKFHNRFSYDHDFTFASIVYERKKTGLVLRDLFY